MYSSVPPPVDEDKVSSPPANIKEEQWKVRQKSAPLIILANPPPKSVRNSKS